MSVDRLTVLPKVPETTLEERETTLAALKERFGKLIELFNVTKGVGDRQGYDLLDEELDFAYSVMGEIAGFGTEEDSDFCVGMHRRKVWGRVPLMESGHAWVRVSSLPGPEHTFQIDRVQFKGLPAMIWLLLPYMEEGAFGKLDEQIESILAYCDSQGDENIVAEEIAGNAELDDENVEVKIGKLSKIPTPGKNRVKIWVRVKLNVGDGDGPTHALLRLSRVYGESGPFEFDRVLLQWK